MRIYFSLFFLLLSTLCFGNMASPYRGVCTRVSSAFTSRDIDILHERIDVNIDHKFKTATYVIEYTVKTDAEGMQIPLLFYAENYKSDFKISVDGQPVNLSNIPQLSTAADSSRFEKFTDAFPGMSQSGLPQQVTIRWTENVENTFSLSDLKYLETSLKRGVHKIRVTYIAGAGEYWGGWIKQYSFEYSLSPAKFWRSFGTLQINLTCDSFKGDLSTNLGEPNHVRGATKTWDFAQLPADYFNIDYTPKPNDFAALAIFIGPFGIALGFTILLAILHLLAVIKCRRAKPLMKYSGATIAGSMLVPLMFFIVYLYSLGIIDNLIGEDASRFHGYIFLIVMLYPFVMPPYWLIMWLIDRYTQKQVLIRQ